MAAKAVAEEAALTAAKVAGGEEAPLRLAKAAGEEAPVTRAMQAAASVRAAARTDRAGPPSQPGKAAAGAAAHRARMPVTGQVPTSATCTRRGVSGRKQQKVSLRGIDLQGEVRLLPRWVLLLVRCAA